MSWALCSCGCFANVTFSNKLGDEKEIEDGHVVLRCRVSVTSTLCC